MTYLVALVRVAAARGGAPESDVARPALQVGDQGLELGLLLELAHHALEGPGERSHFSARGGQRDVEIAARDLARPLREFVNGSGEALGHGEGQGQPRGAGRWLRR